MKATTPTLPRPRASITELNRLCTDSWSVRQSFSKTDLKKKTSTTEGSRRGPALGSRGWIDFISHQISAGEHSVRPTPRHTMQASCGSGCSAATPLFGTMLALCAMIAIALSRLSSVALAASRCEGGTEMILDTNFFAWMIFIVSSDVPGRCVRCEQGHFREASRSRHCEPCGVDTFARAGSSKCLACRDGEVAQPGSWACSVCPAGTWASAGKCEPCAAGSYSENGSRTCSCDKGFTGKASPGGNDCKRCPRNTFKSVRGKRACEPCPFGLTSDIGSDDVSQCQPDGWFGTLSAAPVVALKTFGIVEAENPSERKWLQYAYHGTISRLESASLSAFDAMESLLSRLSSTVLDLFDSWREFYQAQAKARAQSSSICNNTQRLKKWLLGLEEHHVWNLAASKVRRHASGATCKEMKNAARRLLLLVHPDKFLQSHPECTRGASEPLARDFNNEYSELKAMCAGV